MRFSLSVRLTAEFLGTGLLSAAVVGTTIMGERLAGGNPATALLFSTLATVGVLVVLILALMPVSGAHFNPAVTVALAWTGDFSWRQAPAYWAAQCTGALAGAAAAHSLFGLPLFSTATLARTGATQLGSEFVATFGLLCVVWACMRFRLSAIAYAVGVYVAAASWFTPSTCFANPALTLARSASNTIAGIRPVDVLPFVVAQLVGALAATVLFHRLAEGRSHRVELVGVAAESDQD